MPTRYPVNLPGLEDKKIELEPSGIIKPARLLVDGQPAQKGQQRNEMIITRRNGKTTSVFFKPALFDNVPKLRVQDKIYAVVPPIQWYQYLICGIPLILVLFGGLVGAVLGLVAFIFNIRLLRTRFHPALRYLSILGVSAAAYLIYQAVALLVYVAGGAV